MLSAGRVSGTSYELLFSSPYYRDLLNQILKSYGTPIEFMGDKAGGKKNTPEAGEVRVHFNRSNMSQYVSNSDIDSRITASGGFKQVQHVSLVPKIFTPEVTLALMRAKAALEKRLQSPTNDNASPRYLKLVNAVLKELKRDDFQYTEEVVTGKTALTSAQMQAVIEAQLFIETRRLKVVQALWEQSVLYKSQGPDKLNEYANRAEALFVKRIADPLAKNVGMVFGRQQDDRFPKFFEWMKQYGDPYSKKHFFRLMGIVMPNLLNPKFAPEGIENPEDYASPFPWFPEERPLGGMYSPNMPKELVDFITEKYPPNHPFNLPWTVVTLLPESWIGENTSSRNGQEVSRVEKVKFQGKDYWIQATNIVVHPDFSPNFVKMSEVLSANIPFEVREWNGAVYHLDPQFYDHVETMANTFINGDFLALLKSDLNQTKGAVYLSIFPHEGYTGNVKFPFMMDIGVRDRKVAERMTQYGSAIPQLEANVCKELKTVNKNYQCRHIQQNDLEKATQIIWVYRLAGFARAIPNGEAAGHDFPKNEYPGITGHRSVIWVETTDVVNQIYMGIARELFQPEDVAQFSLERFNWLAALHEDGHAVGMREKSPTNTGRLMTKVHGKAWGAIAEPLAEESIPFQLKVLETHPVHPLPAEEAAGLIVTNAIKMAFQSMPPDVGISPQIAEGAPHYAGHTMSRGWCFAAGALTLGPDGKFFKLDTVALAKAMEDFHAELVKYSGRDDFPGYQDFMRKTAFGIPKEAAATIAVAQKKHKIRLLVDRGDLCQVCPDSNQMP